MSAKKASPDRPKPAKRAAPKRAPRQAPTRKATASPRKSGPMAPAEPEPEWLAAPAPPPASPAWETVPSAPAPAPSGWSVPPSASPSPGTAPAPWTGFSAPATGWTQRPSTAVVVLRPTRGLVQPLVLLLAFSVGLSALALVLQVVFTDWGAPSASTGQSILESVLGFASFGVSLALIIVFCMWLHRTLANAKARHPGADIKPGWAVGSFFVPVAHLFLPYFEVRRGWTADVSQDAGPVTAWFVPWALATAAAYVTAIVAASIAFQAAFAQIDAAQDPSDFDIDSIYESVRPLQLVAGAIGLALNATAAFFLARLARQWTAAQEAPQGPPVS
jgi:Domain of unknown function (DUF4328)